MSEFDMAAFEEVVGVLVSTVREDLPDAEVFLFVRNGRDVFAGGTFAGGTPPDREAVIAFLERALAQVRQVPVREALIVTDALGRRRSGGAGSA